MAIEVNSFLLKLQELQECARRLHGCLHGVAAIVPRSAPDYVPLIVKQAAEAALECGVKIENAKRMMGA